MERPKVCVLMSTYNGEKYIREQIDSVLSQKGINVQLVIRDDESTDNTIKIIDEYTKEYHNISYYKGTNIGVGKSFLNLLMDAPEADYYAFADHDDVWLEDKLKQAVEFINKEKSNYDLAIQKNNTLKSEISNELNNLEKRKSIPLLYGSNQTLVDKNLNIIRKRFFKNPNLDLIGLVSKNVVSGCTMVMNNELRREIINYSGLVSDNTIKLRLHDTWCMMVAAIKGKILYDENSYILYRQHDGNVVGAKQKTFVEKCNNKVNRFKTQKYKGVRSNIAKELLVIFNNDLRDEDKIELHIIADCNSLRGGIELCKNEKIVKLFREKKSILLLKAIFGWI